MNALRRSTSVLLLLTAASMGLAQEKDFQGKEVIKANFDGKNLTNANFEDAVIKETSFTSAILKKANFRFASISFGNFRDADLQGADFRDAKLANVFVTGTDFTEANFDGANLADVPMYSTKLRNANLRNLKRSSNFFDCDFYGADLRGANLREMKLYRGCVFRKVKYDGNTIWPTGFDPKEQGAVLVDGKDDAPKTKPGTSDEAPKSADPKRPKPTLGGREPDPVAPADPVAPVAKIVVFQGREDLQGFGDLKFVLPGGGKAEMIDASKKSISGTVRISGDQVTFAFPDCVYEGKAIGNLIEGKARFTKGDNAGAAWNFRVALVGAPNQPANPPVAPKGERMVLRGEEDLPGFGPLEFSLDGKGKVEMNDASKQITRGEYQIAGNRFTMSFPGCVYDGKANGNTIAGKARNDKGDVWNFKVALEGAQPAVPAVDPVQPSPPINPQPGAKLPLDGFYMKIYQANGSAITELYYFTPDGKVSTRPFGGLNPFDWTAAAKSFPGYTGAYTIQGGNILMRMGDGKTRKESYGVNNEGVQLDGYLAQKVSGFPQGAKLTGRWGGSSSSAFGVDRATSGWTFTFGKDGTYELERQGAVIAKGPEVVGSAGANSRERGAFTLSGNTLRLSPSQGPARNLTIFPYEGYGNEQQFNIEGMFFRQTK